MCLASSLKSELRSTYDQPLLLVENRNVGFSISTNIPIIGPFCSDANFLKGYIVATLRGKAHCWVVCVYLKFLVLLFLLPFVYFNFTFMRVPVISLD